MNRLIIAGALCLSALIVDAAWAGANCKAYPKAEWMSEADAKTKIAAMGYAINVFKCGLAGPVFQIADERPEPSDTGGQSLLTNLLFLPQTPQIRA